MADSLREPSYAASLDYPPVVTFDNPDALPVQVASVRKRLSLSTNEFDDMLCEQILEVTELLEAATETQLRPATCVQYFDHMFGRNYYPAMAYIGYGYFPYVMDVPFDLSLKRYPAVEDQTQSVEIKYVDPDNNPQSYTQFELALENIPSKIRFLKQLPAVAENTKAWEITYRCYYPTVPRAAKKAIIQRVVDEFMSRGADRDYEHDLVWQKAIATLTWGPL